MYTVQKWDHGKKTKQRVSPYFTVAFLLFLAPAVGSNPSGPIS